MTIVRDTLREPAQVLEPSLIQGQCLPPGIQEWFGVVELAGIA
jgi:hypothetical protein